MEAVIQYKFQFSSFKKVSWLLILVLLLLLILFDDLGTFGQNVTIQQSQHPYDPKQALINKLVDGGVRIDWSKLIPNVVGNDRVWVVAVQDLPNDTPLRQIYVESAKLYNIHINLVGIGGAERFKEWRFGLKTTLAIQSFKSILYPRHRLYFIC